MGKFSVAVRKQLVTSPYVEDVTDSHVIFSVKFKTLAVQKYLEGFSPSEIFSTLGIDTSLFLPDYPKKSIARWKEVFFKEGVAGFEKEKRGKGSTGRPLKKQFKTIEEEVTYLREENALLKKLQALAEEYLRKNGSR